MSSSFSSSVSSVTTPWERTVLNALKGAIRAHRGLYGKRLKGVYDTFRRIDRDGDGEISPAEFAEALHRLDIGLTESQIVELLELADLNGDGNVDFVEFCRLLGVSPNQEDVGRARARKKDRLRETEPKEDFDSSPEVTSSSPIGRNENDRHFASYGRPMFREISPPPPVSHFVEESENAQKKRENETSSVRKKEKEEELPPAPPVDPEESWRRMMERARERVILQNRLASSTTRALDLDLPPRPRPSTTIVGMPPLPRDRLEESSETTRALRALVRATTENTLLIRTIRNIASVGLGVSDPRVSRLDESLRARERLCEEVRRGGGGARQLLNRAEDLHRGFRSDGLASFAECLTSVELRLEKCRNDERVRWRRILAQEVERCARERAEGARLRAKLGSRSSPGEEFRTQVVSSQSVSTETERAIVPHSVPNKSLSATSVGVQTPSKYPIRNDRALRAHGKKGPPELIIELPEDWDGRSIEVSVSEDEDSSSEEDERADEDRRRRSRRRGRRRHYILK